MRTTCLQRVTDVAKTSVYEHGLGVRYIWRIQQGMTYGEVNGTWMADMARGILILSRNRLFKHDIQLGIILCQDHLVGAMLCGVPRMRKQNDTINFRNRRWF